VERFSSVKQIKNQLLSSPGTSVIILSLSIAVGLLEAVSISTLVPLFEIINNGRINDLAKYKFISYFLETLGIGLSISGILTLFCSFILLKGIFSLVAMSYIGKVVAQIALDMRRHFLKGLLKSNWPSLARKNSGEFLNSINHEIPKAASIYRISCTILGSFFQVIALLIVLYSFSVLATFGGILLGFFLFLALGGFVKLASEQSKIQVVLTKSFMSRIHELLSSIKVIKAMDLVQFVFPIMLSEASKIKIAEQKQIIAKHGLNYLREPIVVTFLCAGLYFILESNLLENQILFASLVLFLRLTTSIGKLQSDYQTFLVNSHFYNSFNDRLIKLQADIEIGGDSPDITFQRSIEYRDVTFSHDSLVLFEGLNLTLPNIGFISITGQSGCGKTTLVDMLLGLYRPNSGSIFVDGKDLQSIGFKGLRGRVGYVQQDPFIFNESVFSNVGLGCEDISRESVIDALKAAHAYSFVKKMEDGIDTSLGEAGSRLSGGQKQRISIARALARTPSILILDEATSALDKTTMLEILEIIKGVSKEILVIAITHQQEVLDESDKIYFIENNVLRELV
jgi:ATP-binding cassette, subfamily C, bacterial